MSVGARGLMGRRKGERRRLLPSRQPLLYHFSPVDSRSLRTLRDGWGRVRHRTVMAELSEVKLTWGEAQHAAQNRDKWRGIVVALCPTGDEED